VAPWQKPNIIELVKRQGNDREHEIRQYKTFVTKQRTALNIDTISPIVEQVDNPKMGPRPDL
jgi:hypothetical protein